MTDVHKENRAARPFVYTTNPVSEKLRNYLLDTYFSHNPIIRVDPLSHTQAAENIGDVLTSDTIGMKMFRASHYALCIIAPAEIIHKTIITPAKEEGGYDLMFPMPGGQGMMSWSEHTARLDKLCWTIINKNSGNQRVKRSIGAVDIWRYKQDSNGTHELSRKDLDEWPAAMAFLFVRSGLVSDGNVVQCLMIDKNRL